MKRYWPYIILILLTIAFFWKAVFLKEIYLPTDRLEQYYPWRYYIQQSHRIHNPIINDPIFFVHPSHMFKARKLLQGILPLWNPHIFAGTPFIANGQSAIFSPFNILFYFFDPGLAANLTIIIQLLLGGIFMYWLICTLKIGKFGALIASIVFMFNGVFISMLEYPGVMGTAMWLPLIFLFLIKTTNENRYIYALISGIFIAIQFLSGYYIGSIYTILAILIYLIFKMIITMKVNKRIDPRIIKTVFLAIGSGVCLAALQLLPTLELARLCQRQITFPNWRATGLIIPFSINLFMPSLLSSHHYNLNWPYYGMKVLFGHTATMRAYVGIIPLVLAFFYPRFNQSKEQRYFFILALFSFCFMFAYPIFSPILKIIPIVNKLRSHNRIDYLFVFSMAVLAGYGADLLSNRKSIAPSAIKKIKKVLWLILGLELFILCGGNLFIKFFGEKSIVALRPLIEKNYGYASLLNSNLYSLNYYLELLDSVFNQIKNSFSFTNINTLCPIIITMGGIVLFKRYLKKGATSFLKFFLLILIIAELFTYGINYNPTGPAKKVYPETESIKFIKNIAGINRVMGVDNPTKLKHYKIASQSNFPFNMTLPMNSAMVFNLYDVRGEDALYLKRYTEFMSIIENKKFDDIILLSNFNSPLLDLLNVKYLLFSPEDTRTPGDKFIKIFDRDLKIYENRKALPRAFLVDKIKVIKKEKDVLKELASPDFNPDEYAIFEEDISSSFSLKSGLTQYHTTILKYEPNKVLINVDTNFNGVLVLSDSYAPGWKVYIDGNEGKIFRTNYILRGVFLGRGSHTVEFIYRPAPYYKGLWLSSITAVSIIIILIISRTQKNKDIQKCFIV